MLDNNIFHLPMNPLNPFSANVPWCTLRYHSGWHKAIFLVKGRVLPLNRLTKQCAVTYLIKYFLWEKDTTFILLKNDFPFTPPSVPVNTTHLKREVLLKSFLNNIVISGKIFLQVETKVIKRGDQLCRRLRVILFTLKIEKSRIKPGFHMVVNVS